MSADSTSAPDEFAKPDPKEAVGLTIVLLLEVFVFMAAVFGIALSDAANNTSTTQALISTKLAGRQNAVAERISGDVVALGAAKSAQARAAIANDLRQNGSAFADGLAALTHGGQIDLGGPTPVTVEPLKNPSQLAALDNVTSAWKGFGSDLALLGDSAAGPAALRADLAAAGQRAGAVVAASRDLAAETGTRGTVVGNGTLRNWLFRVAIITVLAMIVTLFRRVSASRKKLEQYAETLEVRTEEAITSSRQLAEAKAGSDIIMETVDRGLFLLDPEYKIQGQYSRELERMFRLPELQGYNFINLLQRLLTERTYEISRDYLALLFDPKKKERTVLRVNPLAEIEVHFANPTGGFDSKFLNFTFRRIVADGVIKQVFVAVSDITERVRLERELRESEARKERQFEFLLGVLHVEPSGLDDFLKTASEQVATMNDALRASDFATNTAGRMELLRQRLDVVYRAVHTIKGNASMLELTYFEKVCDIFEGKIVQLRERSALGGDDFLSVVIAQSELRQDLDELQDLRERFVGLGHAAASKREAPGRKAETPADVGEGVAAFAKQLAAKQQKDVRVDVSAFDAGNLPDDLRRTVRDVLAQLTRNSLVHGIEDPDVRQSLGKPRAGTITLRNLPSVPAGSFGFSFRDDGQGLDPNKIREKAVEKRIVSLEKAAAMNDQQLIALIFRPAFSTLGEATTDAGRGIGMNVIKEAIVDRFGGSLSISSEPGKFTEFSFMVPLVPKSAQSAPAAPNGAASLAYT
jgi:HPt (histidine-containing phosphotransfer) domain-containing protein